MPGEVTEVELALDTADDARIGPFWAALLTGDAGAVVDDSVVDPHRPAALDRGSRAPSRTRCPASAGTSTCGSRPRLLPPRIAAAVAAGGTVVDDSEAPSFTVLADPDGNKVCVCTSLDRA